METVGSLGKTFESSMAAELGRARDVSPRKLRLSVENRSLQEGCGTDGRMEWSPQHRPLSHMRNSLTMKEDSAPRDEVSDRGFRSPVLRGSAAADQGQDTQDSQDDEEDDCLVV